MLQCHLLKIVEVYGKEAYEFRDHSIVVTIPFDAFSTEAADLGINAQVNAQVEGKDAQVEVSIADKILAFCSDAKSLAEICDFLGYKDRREDCWIIERGKYMIGGISYGKEKR